MRSGDRTPRRRRGGEGRLTAGGSRGGIGPLYERLPHGPHQLDRNEVARNQRARIHGAVIEAVSRHGYERASVKHVIALAGVSRRSFYEQFPNKRDCFLATFDLLAARELRRVRAAYTEAGATLDPQVRAIVGAHLDGARDEPKGTHLLLTDALALGEAGLTRVVRAAAAHEQLLGECFQRAARGTAPSAPLVRALTGGLQGVIGARLGPVLTAPPVSQEMLVDWALAIATPATAGELTPWLAERLRERTRAVAVQLAAAARAAATAAREEPGDRRAAPDAQPGAREHRDDVLEAALRLAARHGHRELTAPQIADAAGVPIESVLAHFATPEACMLAAHARVSDRLCLLAAAVRARETPWPDSVRPTIGALLEQLAARPVHARALVQSSWCLGERTAPAASELTTRLAALLSPDPERHAGEAPPLAGEAAVHALWHVLRCLLASRRMQLLPALTDHLSFLALAPSLGTGPALELLRSAA